MNKSATIYTDVSRKEVFLVAKKVGNRQYKTLKCTVCNEENYRDERNVVDKNGEEINIFNTVNLETFAKYVDQMELVGVRITEGNPNDDYNGWEIYKME